MKLLYGHRVRDVFSMRDDAKLTTVDFFQNEQEIRGFFVTIVVLISLINIKKIANLLSIELCLQLIRFFKRGR